MNKVDERRNTRLLMMLVGNILLGISITLFRNVGFGIDPFTSMTTGMSSTFSISLGVYQMCLNIVLFALTFYCARKLMGIGTFVNMIFVGYLIQFFSFLYKEFLLAPNTIFTKLLLLVLSLAVLVIGMSLYYSSDLGIAPYDCLPIVISEKTKLQFGICRVFCDSICVVIALIFGGCIGLGTVMIAFGTGPLVQFCNKNFAEKLLKDKVENDIYEEEVTE